MLNIFIVVLDFQKMILEDPLKFQTQYPQADLNSLAAMHEKIYSVPTVLHRNGHKSLPHLDMSKKKQVARKLRAMSGGV